MPGRARPSAVRERAQDASERPSSVIGRVNGHRMFWQVEGHDRMIVRHRLAVVVTADRPTVAADGGLPGPGGRPQKLGT